MIQERTVSFQETILLKTHKCEKILSSNNISINYTPKINEKVLFSSVSNFAYGLSY